MAPYLSMKILVNTPTIIGGVCYEPSHLPQSAPDAIGQHLIDIGNAKAYETKVIKPEVTKAKKPSSAPRQAQASAKKTATTRKKKPKS